MSAELEKLTSDRDDLLSLDASICLGKLGVLNSNGAITKLKNVIVHDPDWNKKTQSLEVLIRQFNLKTKETYEYVLIQLEKSPMWTSRVAASKLLSYLGKF